MAHLLGAEQISLEFPTKAVFSQLTVGVNEGDRIGVVGRNGDGKSTLLKILSKRLEPDSGRVTWRGGIRVGLLDQADRLPAGVTIHEAVIGNRAEHEWAGDARIRDVLAGLLNDLDWNQQVIELSGGQQRRVALARLWLSEKPALWILDEPFTAIDKQGVKVLERLFLAHAERGGMVILTTHQDMTLMEGRLKTLSLTPLLQE